MAERCWYHRVGSGLYLTSLSWSWTALEEAAFGDATRGEASFGDATCGEAARGEVTRAEAALGEATLGEVTLGEATLGEATQGDEALGTAKVGLFGCSAGVGGLTSNFCWSTSPSIFSILLGSLNRMNDFVSACLSFPFFFSLVLFFSDPYNIDLYYGKPWQVLLMLSDAKSVVEFVLLSYFQTYKQHSVQTKLELFNHPKFEQKHLYKIGRSLNLWYDGKYVSGKHSITLTNFWAPFSKPKALSNSTNVSVIKMSKHYDKFRNSALRGKIQARQRILISITGDCNLIT